MKIDLENFILDLENSFKGSFDFNSPQIKAGDLVFRVYFVIECLQTAIRRFQEFIHRKNHPIDFGEFENLFCEMIENLILL